MLYFAQCWYAENVMSVGLKVAGDQLLPVSPLGLQPLPLRLDPP
jgi:hypothetical protein